MVITPQSDLILLKCPLELSEEHQLSFSNATAQYNYFSSLPKYTPTSADYTYIRKDGMLRVNAQFDALIEYNYVMYRNDAYSNKWFYAYIEKMEYINDKMTAVYIKTDPYQTWQFSLTYKRTFVEREHVNDDTIGANTVDEGLETGEYIIGGTTDVDLVTTSDPSVKKGDYIVVGVTETPDKLDGVTMTTGAFPYFSIYNGVPSGLTYLFMPSNSIRKFVRMYDMNSKADAIVNMFVIPNAILQSGAAIWSIYALDFDKDGESYGLSGLVIESDNDQTSINIKNVTENAPVTIDGYTPRNNKLLCYPYCYARMTNNGGADFVYRWEDFTSRQAKFRVDVSIVQGMSIKAFPQNYLNGGGGTNEYEYGLTGQKFPTCSWSTDFYLSWVNQQGVNLGVQTGVQVGNAIIAGAVGSAVTGNIGGMAAGLMGAGLNTLSAVSNAMQQIREASLVPDQARGNINSGDVNFSIGKSGFTLYKMNIKAEFARQIDDYFSTFGYKVNRVKIPNVTGRTNWNYVKTINCYIQADIPQDDLQEIKNMFDRGLTIWHNPSTFLDYSQTNAIVS